MRLGVAASLVEGTVLPGDVSVEEGLVSGLGLSPAGSTGLAIPGFVDVQVNGVAGVDFLSADTAGYARASEALARTGVTAFQPTFVSSPVEVAGEAIVALSTLDGPLPGGQALPAHLEGPFISPLHHDAHNPCRPLGPRPGPLRRFGDRDRGRPRAGRGSRRARSGGLARTQRCPGGRRHRG